MTLLARLGAQPKAQTKKPAYPRLTSPATAALLGSWPRRRFELVPDEVHEEGLAAFELVGIDVQDVIERRRSSTVGIQIIRGKFVRRAQAGNPTAEAFVAGEIDLPIPRGVAGPGLLAETIVRRWQNHESLKSQSAVFAGEGLTLTESTLGRWHDELATTAKPLLDSMWSDAVSAPYLFIDSRGALVTEKEKCRTGHFWIVVVPHRHVLYGFSKRGDGSIPIDEELRDYSGYRVVDAHAIVQHLCGPDDPAHEACWGRARQSWYRALASDPERAKVALEHIDALFRIDRTFVDATRKQREAVRRTESRPIVDRFFAWCESQRGLVTDGSPCAMALDYAMNQRDVLLRVVDDGRLPITGNLGEMSMRKELQRRRNWLFSVSEDGTRATSTFVSLLGSCMLHGIEPLDYIRDLLILLPNWPQSRVLELAPVSWKRTLETAMAQEGLDSNIFRSVVLAPA
jgi:transposase